MNFLKKYFSQPIKDDMIILGRAKERTETGGLAVYINGLELSPEHSQSVFMHSPDGFAWGYQGSGPAQLALALLLASGVRKATAIRLHQRFKMDVIAKIPPEDDFRMTMGSVRNWVKAESRKLKDLGEILKNE